MELRNAMEDIVSEYLEMLLKNYSNICKCKKCQLDMKAYALNKLTPHYIVSERGLIHLVMDEEKDVQNKADILEVLDKSIRRISSHIRKNYSHDDKYYDHKNIVTADGNYFNFPNIIGSVFINDSLESVSGIKISLFFNNRLAEMFDEAWQNPYITNKITMGFYNFWVKPIKTKEKDKAKTFHFKFVFEYNNYKKIEKGIKIRIFPDNTIYNYIRTDYVRRISSIKLEKK